MDPNDCTYNTYTEIWQKWDARRIQLVAGIKGRPWSIAKNHY